MHRLAGQVVHRCNSRRLRARDDEFPDRPLLVGRHEIDRPESGLGHGDVAGRDVAEPLPDLDSSLSRVVGMITTVIGRLSLRYVVLM